MSKLSAVDLSFLVLESQNRPLHMASCVVYRPPARQKGSFVPRVLDAFRSSDVGKPFNQQLKWLDSSVARWETAKVDMNYHVKHVAVPGPGTMEQLDDLLSVLNPPLLDRAYPLWQCFVIEGLENGRFAVFLKLHHAMIDGMGGIKAFRNAMSDDPRDKEIRPIWLPVSEPPKRKKSRVSQSQLARFTSQVSSLPSGVMDFTSGLIDFGAQALKRKPGELSLPYQAPATPFNVTITSSARCYGNCEIPLDRVKAIAGAAGCTVNDVVTTFIDDALHKYLVEHDQGIKQPLVTSMAISARTEGPGTGGNQVSADLLPLGQPDATIVERLAQVHESTSRVKGKAQKMSVPMRQLYSMMLFGAATIPEITPGMTAAPSYNLIISNMVGPREQLYMGGAPVVALHGLPIVPPNPALNVTFVGWHDQICLGVASVPEAMRDPGRYIELLLQSVAELETVFLPENTSRGTASGKKPAGRAPRPKKTGSKSTAGKKAPPRRNQ